MASLHQSASTIYDCIVVGAGPAGLAASLQLKRTGLKILVFEKNHVGGLLTSAHQVENYLGFPKISGKELVRHFQKQMQTWKIPIKKDEVTEVKKKGDRWLIRAGKTYFSKSVILATGTTAKKLPATFPLKTTQKIHYDLQNLLHEKTPQIIGIIGGGDLAFDYALHLHEKGHKPIIFVRDKVTCLPLLLKRAGQKKIPIRKLALFQENKQVNSVLVAIGREPCPPKLSSVRARGLFWAGDVCNGPLRQTAIATGDGIQVAMKVTQFLSSLT